MAGTKSRTKIPGRLVHKLDEVGKNAKLFDEFVSLLDFIPDRESRKITASRLFENIRNQVLKDGKVKLPFDMIIKIAD